MREPTEQTFSGFVYDQVMRMSQMHKFPFHDVGAEELATWVERKAAGDRVRVKQLIDDAVEWQDCPSIADLKSIWLRLFPDVENSPNVASPSCAYCHGHGWEVVERVGSSGVERCRCGGFPPTNQARTFTGVSGPLPIEEQREIEEIAARARRALKPSQSLGIPELQGVVAKIRDLQEGNRASDE